MKKLLAITLCAAALHFSGSAGAAQVRSVEQGYEVNELRVMMSTAETGTAIVKECDTCEDLRLEISARTRLFKGNEEIPISEVLRYRGQEGVVFRGVGSNKVTRIKLY